MKAVIPTGGRGTRMRPLTYSTNKHFIPVANKPLIFYPIEAVAKTGIKDICITYNPGWREYIQKFLGDGNKWGVSFTYVLQPQPLGLANIFQVCEKELAGEKFLMHLGDNIFADGISTLVDEYERSDASGMVAKVKHSENWRLGVPIFDEKGNLKDYVEKPQKPPNEYAIPGIYFFNKNVFKCFKGKSAIKPSPRGEYEILEPYKWLINKGYKVSVVDYKGRWLDPGKFDDWVEANQYLLDKNTNGKAKGKIDKNSKITNRVEVGKTSVIKNSIIRGPVSIGDNVEIIDSYVGPYTSIYHKCKIIGSNIENSVILEGVEVKNIKRQIDNSVIGSYSKIEDIKTHSDCVELFIGDQSQIRL